MNNTVAVGSRGGITFTLIISALMVIIDMTIANVVLPNMMGALGATSDQITWVLTSYNGGGGIYSLAGFFTLRFGERTVILTSIIGFVVMSCLCGQSDSLAEMVLFRIFQGAFGAAVIPLAQSLLMQSYPKQEQGKAMAMFSIGALVGPVIGPMLGGMITEHLEWRWVFYINIPVGLCCIALIMRFIHANHRGPAQVDWLLTLCMVLGIGLLQFVLSEGNQKNWFQSEVIKLALLFLLL